MPITTILFDCDNTLVLSEPLAFASCAEVSNLILETYAPHVSHRYTGPELQAEYVGKNYRALMAALEEKHGFVIPTKDLDKWVDTELATTMKYIKAKATPCEGVMPVLEKLQREGKYNIAIVSSSALPRVLASIHTTKQDAYFPSEKVFSAASMTPPTSKPDPAVYLHACEQLGVNPAECVAIEDSRSGATAATRAGIPLMGYVGPYYEEGAEEVERMDRLLKEDCKAVVVMHHWRDFEDCLRKIEDHASYCTGLVSYWLSGLIDDAYYAE
ncbi:uncharacterized protein IL334_005528 [Kwoniella shivajii]|uniref:HAD-like protein n=1 Tax=Kwoniella shivajii TaxID=564305 RepID=A0ABZ1D3Y6_9TREE|nr:hypothetical protein IL334_005528 [Kwoniella shivajii]